MSSTEYYKVETDGPIRTEVVTVRRHPSKDGTFVAESSKLGSRRDETAGGAIEKLFWGRKIVKLDVIVLKK